MNKIEQMSTGELRVMERTLELPKTLNESILLRGVRAELKARERDGKPSAEELEREVEELRELKAAAENEREFSEREAGRLENECGRYRDAVAEQKVKIEYMMEASKADAATIQELRAKIERMAASAVLR